MAKLRNVKYRKQEHETIDGKCETILESLAKAIGLYQNIILFNWHMWKARLNTLCIARSVHGRVQLDTKINTI